MLRGRTQAVSGAPLLLLLLFLRRPAPSFLARNVRDTALVISARLEFVRRMRGGDPWGSSPRAEGPSPLLAFALRDATRSPSSSPQAPVPAAQAGYPSATLPGSASTRFA